MLTATALPRDGHGWPLSSSLAPVHLPASLPAPLWLCATGPTDSPAPVPVGLTAPTLAPADSSTHADAPRRPRGFTLQEIPGLQALWRRTGQTPILRASRQTSIPALELPAGLHMLLTLNGQRLRLLRPGLNFFTPELLLLPGDRLRFEFYPGEAGRSSSGNALAQHPSPQPSPGGRGSGTEAYAPRFSPCSVGRLSPTSDEKTEETQPSAPLSRSWRGDGGEGPSEADILRAAFGDETPAHPPARAVPFANLTRFQRQQRGLLGRLLASLTEGGRP